MREGDPVRIIEGDPCVRRIVNKEAFLGRIGRIVKRETWIVKRETLLAGLQNPEGVVFLVRFIGPILEHMNWPFPEGRLELASEAMLIVEEVMYG